MEGEASSSWQHVSRRNRAAVGVYWGDAMANIQTLAAVLADRSETTVTAYRALVDNYFATGHLNVGLANNLDDYMSESVAWANANRSGQELAIKATRVRDPQALRDAARTHSRDLAALPG